MIDLMKLPAADAERLAYAEGFTGTATLLARLSDAEHARDVALDRVDALERETETLRDALYAALPFVEDAADSDTYKPGYVLRAVNQMLRALGEKIQ
jgi:hypothetical protein